MSLKRKIVDFLDRKGGRTLLAKLATSLARRELGPQAEVFHDGRLWIHRLDSMYFPDDRKFCYYGSSFEGWKDLLASYFANAQDYYLRHCRLSEGDVVLDVGAGRGEDTIAFSRAVGRGGRVVAIEAHPLSYELLEAFCRLNRLANILPVNLAVMDKPGEISMVESDDWRANAVSADGAGGGIRVRATTLDEICREMGIGRIDFLKMNIEGAERYALPGMDSIVRSTRSVCVACHDFLADRG